MLSRLVRIQLVIFTISAIIGVLVMAVNYVQVPTLLGIGKMTVTLELPATGGLYRFSNVTYRGVQIGKVTGIDLTRNGAKATMRLDASSKVPADLEAEIRSLSAVGEQYVDLRPRNDSPPYLHDGSVIAKANTTIPQPIGPVLDQTARLINSIPTGKFSALLDESSKAFSGAGYDFGSLLDSSAKLSSDLNSVADRARTLTEATGPVLDSQAQTTDSIRIWARSLAGFSGQLVQDDPQIRSLLKKGPGAFNETSRLLDQMKLTLPVLLANLTTIGQIGITYHASIEQVLVLLPPFTAAIQSFIGSKNPTGSAVGDFAFVVDDPPGCTVGYLPPSQWRSPADTTTVDTPDGLYCKLPQDSPTGVRGARNYPCMGQPGKRAPTVEICESDKQFEPLATRQHVFGTYPLDPNLIAQGIPPDDRANWSRDRIFGPVEGTPPPAGARSPAPPAGIEPIAPIDVPSSGQPAPSGGEAHAAPSSFGSNRPGSATGGPSLALAHYDPRTGRYVARDGQTYQQLDLVTPPKTWQEMLHP
jgi:phospholipid/cholesterol/gamma-HCH transport system substrate-binding protein